ncbi:hypothetical protein AQS8620_02126 [Aquimixticola soesokkakensis]|uniref:DUF2937 domain-containing protein n=1 Tax=Aquimixticola soesokkakensis TaxID=1519096 RepID=A0A1Y5SVY8_9RHOB|nr:DUF2937 family protein [Aquimixticola soesokkakensis]SLN49659.1 hypothetical protein AQS8620_02126 [Aquimixticola soesokkakensis]
MIMRALAFAGGLFGAALLSQYPEFTQQYTQRLGGQVSALASVVADFDRSARREDMSRDEALAEMGGTPFLDARRRDIRATIARQEQLAQDLDELRSASAMARLAMPQRVADSELAVATWRDFRPALPLSVEGLLAGFAGLIGGYVLAYLMLKFLLWPFRRPTRRAQGTKLDFHA